MHNQIPLLQTDRLFITNAENFIGYLLSWHNNIFDKFRTEIP